MPGETSQTQTQNQNSSTNPWTPTQGSLQQLIDRFSQLGRDPSYMGNISDALKKLQESASSIPNMGGDALAAIKRLFASDNSAGVGMLNQGYGDLTRRLGGLANGEELDPYKTPGFSDAINTMTGDITNSVKGVYSGSGRDPSGAGSFSGSLGRGLTQGIAPVIQSQYNTNNANRMSAANSLFNASGSTASGVAGLKQTDMDNLLKAINASGQLPGLYTGAATAQYGAANEGNNQQWNQSERWLRNLLGISGLGSQSTGSGTTTRTQGESTMGNIIGGGAGLAGLLTSLFGGGGAGGAGALAGLLALSDERTKENKEEIGELHDGQKVYSFNYKGDARPQIGLMAQEVERIRPEAVTEIAGTKFVDYRKATAGARRIGLMRDMLEAA